MHVHPRTSYDNRNYLAPDTDHFISIIHTLGLDCINFYKSNSCANNVMNSRFYTQVHLAWSDGKVHINTQCSVGKEGWPQPLTDYCGSSIFKRSYSAGQCKHTLSPPWTLSSCEHITCTYIRTSTLPAHLFTNYLYTVHEHRHAWVTHYYLKYPMRLKFRGIQLSQIADLLNISKFLYFCRCCYSC